MNNIFYSKGQSLIVIIIILVAAALLGGSYYYFSRQIPEAPEALELQDEPITEPESEPETKVEPEVEPESESKPRPEMETEPKPKPKTEPERNATEISKEDALAGCRTMPEGYDKEKCFLYASFWFRDKSFCDEVAIDLNKCICYAAIDVFLKKNKTEQEQILKGDPLDNEEIKKAISDKCPETIALGIASRNSNRITEMTQIRMTQEMYHGIHNKYYQSIAYPASIPNIMETMPTDPLTGGPYGWIDNTGDPQKFCVYANLEEKGFYVVSHRGTGELGVKPTTLTDCEKF